MTKMNANARHDRAASAPASTGRPRKAAAPLSNRRGSSALEGAANGELAGGAGLFAGVIELSTDASLRVRLSSGELVTAAAAPGLDARLVDECLTSARDAGYQAITLWTNDVLAAARRIYQRHGFTLVAEEAHHSFGHDLVGQTWHREL